MARSASQSFPRTRYRYQALILHMCLHYILEYKHLHKLFII